MFEQSFCLKSSFSAHFFYFKMGSLSSVVPSLLPLILYQTFITWEQKQEQQKSTELMNDSSLKNKKEHLENRKSFFS